MTLGFTMYLIREYNILFRTITTLVVLSSALFVHHGMVDNQIHQVPIQCPKIVMIVKETLVWYKSLKSIKKAQYAVWWAAKKMYCAAKGC